MFLSSTSSSSLLPSASSWSIINTIISYQYEWSFVICLTTILLNKRFHLFVPCFICSWQTQMVEKHKLILLVLTPSHYFDSLYQVLILKPYTSGFYCSIVSNKFFSFFKVSVDMSLKKIVFPVKLTPVSFCPCISIWEHTVLIYTPRSSRTSSVLFPFSKLEPHVETSQLPWPA